MLIKMYAQQGLGIPQSLRVMKEVKIAKPKKQKKNYTRLKNEFLKVNGVEIY